MSITFSSCFYIIKSKFEPSIYVEWMNNLISIVNNFNLVIYTDENSKHYINTNGNDKIKIIIKPLEEFYNYKYKDNWIENHKKNFLLNNDSKWKTVWQLNMLWSEKIWFVKDTIFEKYFDTDYYGWCDIGYFREINNNLYNWPNNEKIQSLNHNKIVYGIINNDAQFLEYLYKIISNKNNFGLPENEIPPDQNSVAGGFFILFKNKIEWWAKTYNDKLELYFKHNYTVKDDQIILIDCILNNCEDFELFTENNSVYDNWFMFQRVLL
jgi:hypothetical protein